MKSPVVLAVVTALSALALVGCSSQGNVFDLEVGTCFDNDATGEISDVPIVDCAEPHDNEVYAVWNIPDGPLPSTDLIDAGCVDRFDQLTPVDDTFVGVGFGYIAPSADSFADGDREVICVISFQQPRTGSAFVELDPAS